MKKLIKIVAKKLNIHEEPISDKNSVLEITMKELYEIVEEMIKKTKIK